MVFAALVGATLLAALPVHVEAGDCPSGTEIERRLQTMLPAVSSAAADVARVKRSGADLHIELVNDGGALIAERVLGAAGTCAELADMVAVIVASWESDVHPRFTGPSADPILAAPTTTAAFNAGARRNLDVAAGAGASLADSVSFGGAVAVSWFPKGVGLGARLSGVGETTHTTYVGIHEARWNRWLVGAEVDWRFPGATTSLDIHGGLALAILQASGVNFTAENVSDTSLSPAVLLGGRWSLWVSRRWAAYADVTAGYCLRQQFLRGITVDGIPVRHELSPFQGLLSLGLAFGHSFGPR
jgi:hypothetical protein